MILKKRLEDGLVLISAGLLIGLVVVVVYAVIARKLGQSPIWYDELASIMLVWLTYIGSAAAACKRSHLGFTGLLNSLSKPLKLVLFALSELAIIGFFLIVAVYGIHVQVTFQDETLITLPWFPLSLSQAIIPISAIIYVIAEILSIPDAIRQMS